MWNRKFGRNADHRKAMLRNLATSVIMYGKVETTEAKAKDMRSVVDELITLGKKGDLAARRQAAAFVRNVVADEKTGQTVLKKLFEVLDLAIYNKSRGFLNVKTVLAGVIGFYGIKKLRKSNAILSGWTLLWWASSLLRGENKS